jgi:two-component system, NarL family, invasion response regulator UvrY
VTDAGVKRTVWPEQIGAAGAVRILVVDDQETFREAMEILVAATPGFTLAGEAPSGEDAIAAVDELAPHLVLMDVRMAGMGGLEAARTLAELHPEVVVILTSVYGPEELPQDMVDGCRAAAFARKQTLRPRLLLDLWEKHRRR